MKMSTDSSSIDAKCLLDRFLDAYGLTFVTRSNFYSSVYVVLCTKNSTPILAPVFVNDKQYGRVWMTCIQLPTTHSSISILYYFTRVPWWTIDLAFGNMYRSQGFIDVTMANKTMNPLFKCNSLEEMYIKCDILGN